MFKKQLAEIQARRAAGEKGFTLAAIAVPIFLNQRSNAQASADKSTVSTIAKTLATGQSTGGTATVVDGQLVVVEGSGATANRVTTPIPAVGARVLVGAGNPDGTIGSDWCVEVGQDEDGTGGFHMKSGDTTPQTGSCSE